MGLKLVIEIGTSHAFIAKAKENRNGICFVNVRGYTVGRDSSVGIATRYGLDGPGIEFRWEERFSARAQTGSGAHPASYTTDTGSFAGVKRLERGVDHPPHPASMLKKK